MATATGMQDLLPDIKMRVQIDTTNHDYDAQLDLSLTGAWRQIHEYTGRRFYSATETRYYTATNGCELMTDDILSITALRTDPNGDSSYETTWSATCYYLTPYNATGDGHPFTGLEIAQNSSAGYFPTGVRRGVQIVGTFGHNPSTALPEDVREAILWVSEQNFRAHHAPFGAVGGREFGQEMQAGSIGLHPFARRMLDPYRRRGLH